MAEEKFVYLYKKVKVMDPETKRKVHDRVKMKVRAQDAESLLLDPRFSRASDSDDRRGPEKPGKGGPKPPDGAGPDGPKE